MSEPTPAAAPPRRRFAMRDALLVARFELGEALRTRLLVVMILLFVGGGGLAAWGFAEVVAKVETTAGQAMGAPEVKKAGAGVERLRGTPAYRHLLRSVTGDEKKTDYFMSLPPMVLFYGWITLMLTPLLVLFTASDSIASEVASRAIRYTTLRTGRLEYALGKGIGQLLLLAGVTALSGLTFFVVGLIFLVQADPGATALGIVAMWPRVLIHALPFLAFALCASMVSSSTNMARSVAMIGAVVLAILSGMAGVHGFRTGSVSNALWDLVAQLTPFGHTGGFSYPHSSELAVDTAVCLGLSVLYFGLGFLRLRKRDL